MEWIVVVNMARKTGYITNREEDVNSAYGEGVWTRCNTEKKAETELVNFLTGE